MLLTILLFEDLAIRAGGPLIDVLMLDYVCSCCEETFGVNFVEIGSSIARFQLFGQLIVALDSPCHRLSACQFWLKSLKSSQSC